MVPENFNNLNRIFHGPTQVSYTVIAIIVVPLAFVIINALFKSSLQRSGREAVPEQTVFHVSPWVFAVVGVTSLMGGAFVLWGTEAGRPESAQLTFHIVGGVCLVGAAAGAWWYARCRVLLTQSGLTIITPLDQKHVPFENLKAVRVSSGLIVLDEGRIPRTVIPMIYRRSNVMLASIEHHLNRAKAG